MRWIITLPLALILVIFAINNRHIIELSLWPFYYTIQWPLYVFLYISLIVGFLIGAFLIWVSGIQVKMRYHWLKKNKNTNEIKIKDAIGKMVGSLIGTIYTFYNLYNVIKL